VTLEGFFVKVNDRTGSNVYVTYITGRPPVVRYWHSCVLEEGSGTHMNWNCVVLIGVSFW